MKVARLLILLLITVSINNYAQKKQESAKPKDVLSSSSFSGLKWRGIGPAFTSGRIADFAVNPKNHSEYYVAVASGHVWKTVNAGVTWAAVTDTLPYSIGVVVMDPNNSHVVWVGTGENNHQRALGWGNGVYKTTDGGKSWKHVGLKDSRQIGGIIIDPRNSNVVYVAAEGSTWGPGGERGLYKTTDGGKTWNKVLNISENTGVNNVVFDPRDPDVIYATSEQRRRHIFSKIGGGPESAVYKSVDAGATWEKIMSGLPKVDIGGMGIAVSPVNPDVVYLIVQAAENGSGFYRSTNRGASWEKMSDHHESGQYYNEIYCDPKNVDKVYSVETVSHVTVDAGRTWKPLGLNQRHVDDHALWIDPNDTEHFLIGGDGGIYETFDGGEHYDFKENLPVTQFYRVNVDNDLPFYNIYGGTQDNNSFGGPSQTISADGIVNDDWIVTNGGDGFWTAIDPTNPDIVYAESQYGGMVRYDRKSGEAVSIRPEPGKGEKTYKWYWDTPLIISPHSPTRLYCAAERVFRSDDRGDSWQVISDDLTTQTDRNTFPVMGKYWSYDAVAKDVSTSLFGLIVSFAESSVKENLLYAGTDDGLIQVSEDAKTWRKIEIPGVPKFTLVSDVLPDKFNENVVYVSFNNHKRDDFKPYIFKSMDKGKTWKSIANNLPVDGPVNTIEQDFVNPNLLFVGTEWSFFFSLDGGEKWIELKNGLPKVKVCDIVLQQRENDIVIATFGRGFYIIDDFTPLRLASKEILEKDSYLFPVKDALTYVQKGGRYGQGSTYFKSPNPEFGATFTYYVKEAPKTLKAERTQKEKELFKDGKPIPQPSFDDIRSEQQEKAPYLIFTIKDDAGLVVKKITKSVSAGLNRIVWDLRYESTTPVIASNNKFDPDGRQNSGIFAMPGKYSVELSMVYRGEEKKSTGPADFNIVVLNNTTLPAANRAELTAFQKKGAELVRTVMGAQRFADELMRKVETIRQTINNTPGASFDLMKKATAVAKEIDDILFAFNGPPVKASFEETPPRDVTLIGRLRTMTSSQMRSTSNVTAKQKVAFEVLYEEIQPVLQQLKKINDVDIKGLETELEKVGAPWTPGRTPELK
ncbi:MAG: glycosyl hydrolase [Melioribacteraceae bacterium]|nr:glycosyl hydrolase [Melioribacteraceae bacterium]